MAIPTAQLETWRKHGPTGQFTATYDKIKTVLHDKNSPYANQSFESFLQGSYKNDTNVYGDSDVDIVISLNSVHYYDLSQLSPEDTATFNQKLSSGQINLPTFKNDVVGWLTKQYGKAVRVGNKAVFISGDNSGRRAADVLVAAKLLRYHTYKGPNNSTSTEGICFFNGATRIDNFPKLHSERCTAKHQATNEWFKATVRVFKNLRNLMIERKLIEAGLAPSYFIEGLLYNVPNDRFGGGDALNFKDVLEWVFAADRTKFECANGQFYLFHDTSPVTWRAGNCTAFLNAVSYTANTW